MPSKTYLEVAVAASIPKTLTYQVPEKLLGLAAPGKRVLVPLGRRKVTGYILGPAPEPEGFAARPIQDVLDEIPLFPESMKDFFQWVSDYYLYPLGQVIKEALPSGLTVTSTAMAALTDQGKTALADKHPPATRTILEALLKNSPMPVENLLKTGKKPAPRSRVLALEKRGLVHLYYEAGQSRVRPRMEKCVRPEKKASDAPRRMLNRHKILKILDQYGEMPARDLKKHVPGAAKWLDIMEAEGEISLFEKELYRDPFGDTIEPETGVLVLNDEQVRAYAAVEERLGKGFSTFLLDGVTGSGKTRVYLQAAARALEQDLSVIVLVPEIALITQMEKTFRARFGNSVAVLHSGLSDGERLDQWMRIVRGQAPITIGARSSIFAPYERLGLIVVDEEHDESYKQETHLKYQARDLAVVRARFEKAVALLGSATPSLQSHRNVSKRKFSRLVLSKRVENRPQPEITVVDLRIHGGQGKSLITPLLKKHLEQTLAAKEQAILFLNRRGFANYPVCRACGSVLSCKDCDISLTLHQGQGRFACHYCGHEKDAASACPECGSPGLELLGAGTEKIEETLARLFPKAKIARLDRDVISRKGALLSVLKGLRDGETDILIGTQMVAKGHDFPNITLVGVVCADLSLGFPDFRAGERTFQLLSQVAGRAGRGEKPGRVILQTFKPEHYCITDAQAGNYRGFTSRELRYRKELGYPPFSRLAQVRITGQDPDRTARFANQVGKTMNDLASSHAQYQRSIQVLGPIPSPIARIARNHRWQILVKGLDDRTLRPYLRAVNSFMEKMHTPAKVQAVLDVDPVNML